MITAPESTATRHARKTTYTPRPLPVWLQVGVVVLLLWNGLQAITHRSEPSLAANTAQAAPSAPQERVAYYYQPDNLRASENQSPEFQYSGYYAHAASVQAMPMRAYAPSTGRWVERDPLPAK